MAAQGSNSKLSETEAATTWDSDIDVSSDDDNTGNTKKRKNEASGSNLEQTQNKASPAPKAMENERKAENNPSHLMLSLLDSYNESAMYSKIRKRRIQKQCSNRDAMSSNSNERKQEKKVTINDMKSYRILYEMNNYESSWLWIDSLPTDDVNDQSWIEEHSNINAFGEEKERETGDDDVFEYIDIETVSDMKRISIHEFESCLNEARKSVINSPLYPELGCCGYCKEFYVTLCDWNAEGVLSIKYVSDEARRSSRESQSLQTCNGYWQRLRYQLCVSRNGEYIAILFDAYCVIRSCVNNFCDDMYKIKLPSSYWQYTQFRCIEWSRNNELLAIASYNGSILIYDDKCDEILAFNCVEDDDVHISGMIWRKYNVNSKKNNYWLELMILFENGNLHRRGLEIDGVSGHGQVINLMSTTRVVCVQYPHSRVREWIYDGLDYFEDTSGSYLAISCLASSLLDTAPRQSRLGSGLMLLRFDADDVVVAAHYNSRIPSNSYFAVDSVCFTMADRRCKLRGRSVSISGDGKHILCLDLRGNMELFAYLAGESGDSSLELVSKIGNVREMSYGSYRSDCRIFDMKWYDCESIVILFANNTFCISPILSIKHYTQRELKWSLNYLGQERESLYGLPIISATVPCVNDAQNKVFFILEISEAYLRRKQDANLNYISHATNDIDRQQNEMYGFRKYRRISLSTFASITSLQLCSRYLSENKYDKALQIAKIFKLNTDNAYKSQFNFLISQYNKNEEHNKNDNNDKNNNENNKECATNFVSILSKINDEKWIIDTLLSVSVCNFSILDSLLSYGLNMISNSQSLRDYRANGFAQFLKYRERAQSLREANLDLDYLSFRDANLIQIGYDLASSQSFSALNTMFEYHWHEKELANIAHRLRILSFIPLTVDCDLYASLLPSIRAPHWKRNRWFAQEFGLKVDDDGDDGDIEVIISWYKMRIYDIQNVTGNVENSLILCDFAVSHAGIVCLAPLLKTLLLFHKVIYEYNVCNLDDVSIAEFEAINANDKLLFVLRDSRPSSIIDDIAHRSKYFVDASDVPFCLLYICGKLSECGRCDLVSVILREHDEFDLLSVVKRDYAMICRNWFPDEYQLIGDTNEDLLISYGLLNALKCRKNDVFNWDGLNSLFCVLNSVSDEYSLSLTHFGALIDGGSKLCKSYEINRSLIFYYTLFKIGTSSTINSSDCDNILLWKEILNVSDHEFSNYEFNEFNIVKELARLSMDITRNLLCEIQQKAKSYCETRQWNALKSDLLTTFARNLFPFMDREEMEFAFYSIVFKCCAFDFISHSNCDSHVLHKLGVSTASELIDSCTDAHDSTLDLALECLSLIPLSAQNDSVWRLRDLIFALRLLCDEFDYDGAYCVPFKLRRIFDNDQQLDFINDVLSSSPSSNYYLKRDHLVQIFEYLQYGGDFSSKTHDRVSLLCILADAALAQNNCQFAYDTYFSIFANCNCKNLKSDLQFKLWNICCKLLLVSNSNCSDSKSIDKFELLSHSLTTSSSSKMGAILKEWRNFKSNSNNNCRNFGQGLAPYCEMNKEEIAQEIGVSEMQKLVNKYFWCDPDLLLNHENCEIYSFLRETNKYWKQFEILTNSIANCCNVCDDGGRHLIQNVIDNLYLFHDDNDIQLCAFLLLVNDDDIQSIKNLNQSFCMILAHENIAIYKKENIAQIATKYFVIQLWQKLDLNSNTNNNYNGNELFFNRNNKSKNIEKIHEMIEKINLKEEEDEEDDDDDDAIIIIIMRKYAKYFYNKWHKLMKLNSNQNMTF